MIEYAYLVDVLALELGKELGEALLIGLDTDGRENLLDVRSGRRGVTTKGEEHVGCDVLHFGGFLREGCQRSGFLIVSGYSLTLGL